MSLPIVVALVGLLVGISAIGVLSGAMRRARDRQHRRHDDRPRCRHRLRAVHPGPAPPEPRVRHAGARGHRPGERHRRSLRPVRRVTVVLAIAGLQVSGIPMMTTMGWASAIMVAVSMLAAVTLLPALLGIAKRRVNSVRIPFIKQRPAYDPQSKSARWTARVVAHPVRYGVAAALVLVVLADPGVLDAARLHRRRQRRPVDDHPQGVRPDRRRATAPASTARSWSSSTRTAPPTRRPPSTELGSELSDVTGVASVDAPVLNEKGDLAIIGVTPDHRAAGRGDLDPAHAPAGRRHPRRRRGHHGRRRP